MLLKLNVNDINYKYSKYNNIDISDHIMDGSKRLCLNLS